MNTGKPYLMLISVITLVFVYGCSSVTSGSQERKYYAQDEPAFKREFPVKAEEGEKILRYGNHYVVSKTPESYKVRIFNPDSKVLNEIKTFSTPALSMLHGEYQSYWDDGSIYRQGIFQYGRKHGVWVESEPGGGISWSGEYINNNREGLWTQLDSNGIKEATYEYLNGQRHGKHYLFDQDGNKINEGLFRADTLISKLFKGEEEYEPVLQTCSHLNSTHAYDCSMKQLRQFFISKMKYPPLSVKNEIEGEAVIQFDVLQDGSVSNIRVPLALNADIENELRRVASQMPAWKAGSKNGTPVKSTITLSLNFVL